MDTTSAQMPPARRRLGALWIVIAVLVLLGIWAAAAYNGLVSQRQAVDNSWSQVETQYQRRFDLIPNLVSTVKGAANFEQETLTQVTEARTRFLNAGADRAAQIGAAQQFDSALSRLLVTVESYPQLKATQAFQDLMVSIEGTENRIAVARKDYNDAVQQYNVRVQRFPGLLWAGLFGFRPEAFFQGQAGSETAPQVDFTQ